MSKKPENKSEEILESALDRISVADEIDIQVDREIWRYWNGRVSEDRPNDYPLRRLRKTIVSALHGEPRNDPDASDDDAYQKGLAFYKSNYSKQSNPYRHGSSRYESWEMGWQQGFDESFDEDIW